mmetsp:Transcript_18044/g.72283  ORF Transcript_18044/g.72283 Transcript_18044/m.72283 type:complete len:135 (-) Transcript_18044:339-743(-)
MVAARHAYNLTASAARSQARRRRRGPSPSSSFSLPVPIPRGASSSPGGAADIAASSSSSPEHREYARHCDYRLWLFTQRVSHGGVPVVDDREVDDDDVAGSFVATDAALPRAASRRDLLDASMAGGPLMFDVDV